MVRLDWMTAEEREKWDAMEPAEKTRINMAMADEFSWTEEILQRLEDNENSPERVARRARIEKHIGRPLQLNHAAEVEPDTKPLCDTAEIDRRSNLLRERFGVDI